MIPLYDVCNVLYVTHTSAHRTELLSDREEVVCAYSCSRHQKEGDCGGLLDIDSSDVSGMVQFTHDCQKGYNAGFMERYEGHCCNTHDISDIASRWLHCVSTPLIVKTNNDHNRTTTDRSKEPAGGVIGSSDVQDPEPQQAFKSNYQTNCRRFLRTVLGCPRALAVMLNVSKFRNPMFSLYMVYAMFNAFAGIPLDYLPALVEQNGLVESQAALLISIYGGIDLVCRVSCAFIASTKAVRMTTLTMISCAMLAVVMHFVRFMSTFEHFVVFVIVQGLLGGVSFSLFPVVVIEIVGEDSMAECLGWNQLVSGTSLCATYTLLGKSMCRVDRSTEEGKTAPELLTVLVLYAVTLT